MFFDRHMAMREYLSHIIKEVYVIIHATKYCKHQFQTFSKTIMIFLLVSFDRNLKVGLWKHIKVFDTACNLTTNHFGLSLSWT